MSGAATAACHRLAKLQKHSVQKQSIFGDEDCRSVMNAFFSEAVWVIGMVAWAIIRYPFQRRTAKIAVTRSMGGVGDKVLLILAVAGQFLIPMFYVISGFPAVADYAFRPVQAYLGVAAILMALVMFRLTHKQLGNNWSITLEIRQGHRFVTDGVYRYMRHPMYTSFFLLAAGQALLIQNWVAGPVGLVSIAALVLGRISREEKLMIDAFGDEYRAYMRRAKRIVPWLI